MRIRVGKMFHQDPDLKIFFWILKTSPKGFSGDDSTRIKLMPFKYIKYLSKHKETKNILLANKFTFNIVLLLLENQILYVAHTEEIYCRIRVWNINTPYCTVYSYMAW